MSTKIHNGYRLATSDLTVLHNLCTKLRRELAPLVENEIAQDVVTRAVARFDGITLGRIPSDTQGPLRAVWSALLDDSSELTERFTVSIVVLPNTDDLPLALVYAAPDLEREVVARADGLLEPYPYWDNTDRPADLTESEWHRRAAQWAKALYFDDHVRPLDAGFHAVLTHPLPVQLLDDETIAWHLPSLDERALVQAREVRFRDLFDEFLADSPDQSLAASRALAAVRRDGDRIADLAAQMSHRLVAMLEPSMLRFPGA